jgi:hypothetical protein
MANVPRGRPKAPGTPDAGVYVRLTAAQLETLRAAVAKEMRGVTGATPSVPKFMLAASLDRALKVLGKP